MNFQKINAFWLVIGLIFQAIVVTPAAAFDGKRRALTPEQKQNALKILSSVTRGAELLGLAENRVRIRTIVADLMWGHDEREARAIYQNALVELQGLFKEVDGQNFEKLSDDEKAKAYPKLLRLVELRREYVLTLAPKDAAAALKALAALKTKPAEAYDPLETTELELQVTSLIVKSDPEKAYALAKEKMVGGLNSQFLGALKDLHKKDSKTAAKLGRDILARIKSAKIIPNSTGVQEKSAENGKQPEIEFWHVAAFVNAASEMNRAAARDKDKKTLPLLSEAEMRELADFVARVFLSASNPAQFLIGSVMPEITRYAPAQAQRIRLKVGPALARHLDNLVESSALHIARNENNADELAQVADRAAPDKRDALYVSAAGKALDENEPEKAQSIAARIKDRKNYAYLFEQIETAVLLAKARRGDLAEVRKILVALKSEQERVDVTTELAKALIAKGENEPAKKLLEETLNIISSDLKKQTDLESTAKVAAVYAVVAPDFTFMMVEHSIDQMNKHISAGITLDEFYDYGSIEGGELFYDRLNRQALLHVPNSMDLLKNLANADFERAVNLADKFQKPEIRLFVRLRIAQSLLDAEAAEKEKKARVQVQSEDEYH